MLFLQMMMIDKNNMLLWTFSKYYKSDVGYPTSLCLNPSYEFLSPEKDSYINGRIYDKTAKNNFRSYCHIS